MHLTYTDVFLTIPSTSILGTFYDTLRSLSSIIMRWKRLDESKIKDQNRGHMPSPLDAKDLHQIIHATADKEDTVLTTTVNIIEVSSCFEPTCAATMPDVLLSSQILSRHFIILLRPVSMVMCALHTGLQE
ncbi:hypothetical protein HYQ45_002158 [Verticillium longisporum]|uniref:Uncharacterized protein n=1 Tax=Verticillium longisporum TaxID=100787 RepID=A0A8I2ZZT3_VERLO|nr:hypothetical protein HYQ45_002158 [Verticillium longisporum]